MIEKGLAAPFTKSDEKEENIRKFGKKNKNSNKVLKLLNFGLFIFLICLFFLVIVYCIYLLAEKNKNLYSYKQILKKKIIQTKELENELKEKEEGIKILLEKNLIIENEKKVEIQKLIDENLKLENEKDAEIQTLLEVNSKIQKEKEELIKELKEMREAITKVSNQLRFGYDSMVNEIRNQLPKIINNDYSSHSTEYKTTTEEIHNHPCTIF